MSEYLSPYQIARYEGYLLALEDVLSKLADGVDLGKWATDMKGKIEGILKQDKHEKFNYSLETHSQFYE